MNLAIQITDALVAAHAQGILHRDIRPANIFVTRDDQVKLLGLGLANVGRLPVTSEAPTRIETPHLSGQDLSIAAAAHMSPEQVLGKAIDARSDLFSVGVVLYEMATAPSPSRVKAWRRSSMRFCSGSHPRRST